MGAEPLRTRSSSLVSGPQALSVDSYWVTVLKSE